MSLLLLLMLAQAPEPPKGWSSLQLYEVKPYEDRIIWEFTHETRRVRFRNKDGKLVTVYTMPEPVMMEHFGQCAYLTFALALERVAWEALEPGAIERLPEILWPHLRKKPQP